jgi:hypothetical protein
MRLQPTFPVVLNTLATAGRAASLGAVHFSIVLVVTSSF